MFDFFGMSLQIEIITIVIVLAMVFAFLFAVNRAIKQADPLAKPKGVLLIGLIYYKMMTNFVSGNMGKKAAKHYAPYIAGIAMFMFLSNVLGLIALPSPTANYSVTLTLALITWLLLQGTKIHVNGIKGYLHSFIEPFPPFIVMNVFGLVAPLISMSLRLFGNITSGSVLMMLFYTFTEWLSAVILRLNDFNLIGILFAPFLHAYFDVFAGFIQTYIFISLTTIFIGIELPQD